MIKKFEVDRIYRNKNNIDVDWGCLRSKADYDEVKLMPIYRTGQIMRGKAASEPEWHTVNKREFSNWTDVTRLYEKED